MVRRSNTALRSLKYASGETGAFINGLVATSERLAERSSEALIGTFGGVLGAICGYTIPIAAHLDLQLVLTLPLGSALGIITAMILWRGPTRMLRERRQRALEVEVARAQAFGEAQLKKLGHDAPPELVEYYKKLPLQYLRERGVLSIAPSVNALQVLPPQSVGLLTVQSHESKDDRSIEAEAVKKSVIE